MSDAVHTKFEWNAQAISAMLERVGISKLELLNEQRTSLTCWPQREQWAEYVDRLSAATGYLLDEEERGAIEKALAGAEEAFDRQLLAMSSAEGASQTLNERELLETMQDIQEQVCRQRAYAHAAYPYFARWVILHFGVLWSLGGADANRSRAIDVWKGAHAYLVRAHQSACGERSAQIDAAITGALEDRLYIRDTRLKTALTLDVPIGGEEESQLWRVMEVLRYEAAASYAEELSLKDGIEILAQVDATDAVLPHSPIEQDEMMEAKVSWLIAAATLDADIAASRAACGENCERIVVSRARIASSVALAHPRTSVRAGLDGWDLMKTIVTSIAGYIPGFGGAISGATGLLLEWMEPDKWAEFEKHIRLVIKAELDAREAKTIKRELDGFDTLLDSFLGDYDRHASNGGLPSNLSDLRWRIGSLSDRLLQFQHHIFKSEASAYLTVPHFEHYLLLSATVHIAAEKFGGLSADFADRRRKLYESSEHYLVRAIDGISNERRNDIQWVDTHVYDTRLGTKLTDGFQRQDFPKLMNKVASDFRSTAKFAAGIIAAQNLMRVPAKILFLLANADKTAGFDSGRIERAYNARVAKLQQEFRGEYDRTNPEYRQYFAEDVREMRGRSYDSLSFAWPSIFTIPGTWRQDYIPVARPPRIGH